MLEELDQNSVEVIFTLMISQQNSCLSLPNILNDSSDRGKLIYCLKVKVYVELSIVMSYLVKKNSKKISKITVIFC